MSTRLAIYRLRQMDREVALTDGHAPNLQTFRKIADSGTPNRDVLSAPFRHLPPRIALSEF